MHARVVNQERHNLGDTMDRTEFRRRPGDEVTGSIEPPFFMRSADDSMLDSETRPESPVPNSMSRNTALVENEASATLLSSYFDISLP